MKNKKHLFVGMLLMGMAFALVMVDVALNAGELI
jgi:hypothetical protein